MSSIYYSTPLTVPVTDVDGVRAVYIFAEYPSGLREVVYASKAGGEVAGGAGLFGTKYAAGGARSSITNGFSYTFARSGGWLGSSLLLTTHAIDALGNLTVTEATYDVVPAVAIVPAVDPGAQEVTHELDAIDVLLDADGDLDLSTGDLQFSRGAAAVKQSAQLRLGLVFGEWYLNTADGTDWFGQILVKRPNLPAINAHLRERILGVPFVSEVTRQAIQFDPVTREAQIVFRAETEFGDTGTVAAGVNLP